MLYYLLHHVVGTSEPIPFAMVRRYSRPDAAILSHTYGTLAVSTLEKTKMHAVQIKDIRSVVGMVPLPKFDARSGLPYIPAPKEVSHFFLVEKLGFEVMELGGRGPETDEEE